MAETTPLRALLDNTLLLPPQVSAPCLDHGQRSNSHACAWPLAQLPSVNGATRIFMHSSTTSRRAAIEALATSATAALARHGPSIRRLVARRERPKPAPFSPNLPSKQYTHGHTAARSYTDRASSAASFAASSSDAVPHARSAACVASRRGLAEHPPVSRLQTLPHRIALPFHTTLRCPRTLVASSPTFSSSAASPAQLLPFACPVAVAVRSRQTRLRRVPIEKGACE